MIRFGRDLATEAGMAGKDISVKKYVVRLSAGERQHLQALVGGGTQRGTRVIGDCCGGVRNSSRTCIREPLRALAPKAAAIAKKLLLFKAILAKRKLFL